MDPRKERNFFDKEVNSLGTKEGREIVNEETFEIGQKREDSCGFFLPSEKEGWTIDEISHWEEVGLEIDPDEGRDAQKKGKEKCEEGFSEEAPLIPGKEEKKIGQKIEQGKVERVVGKAADEAKESNSAIFFLILEVDGEEEKEA